MAPTDHDRQQMTADDTPFTRTDTDTLVVSLDGDWERDRSPVLFNRVTAACTDEPTTSVTFNATALGRWDSSLLVMLGKLELFCNDHEIHFVRDGLPDGIRRLLALARSPGNTEKTVQLASVPSLPERTGNLALAGWRNAVEMVSFLGEVTVAFGNLLSGRADCRRADILLVIQECGVQALPIVSLISLLVGLIFAFVGAVQLAMFGAQIYVASLVGITIVRIMGAVMAGVLMAGRTGAAFAAQIGTMKVNEEIDALVTLGVNPIEFLVVPRVLALVLMMPLLCLYADLMGIVGGLLVGTTMLDLNIMEYIEMTKKAIRLQDLWIGVFHSGVFGLLIALAGCHRGIRCERNASAVGQAATSAVVTGIVSIVCATAVITVICNVLRI